ncbi:TIGR03086 family metal-binding protein [Actinomycetota bacterium Odt1-20B]
MTTHENAHRIGDLLAVAADGAAPVVRALPDDRLSAPTPCAEYDVKDLVDHLFQVVVHFQDLAAKRDSEFDTGTRYVVPGADWRAGFGKEADALVAAWSEPGAEEGTTGAMNMPARTVGCMVLLDLTVHAWDLARATGQAYEADPRVVAVLSPAVERMAPMAREMGVFGESVSAPEGAGDFERLLAVTGRDPAWAPVR